MGLSSCWVKLLLGFQANSTPGHAEDRFYRFNVDRGNARRHVCNPIICCILAQDLDRPIPKIPFRRPSAAIVPYAQPVLADDVLRYVGEPVAMVLAEPRNLPTTLRRR
jgi:CO/xanthine dehydrogenase Mo-binding subunit